jgi:peptidoglycan-N-acetylglucosamine deacetylase
MGTFRGPAGQQAALTLRFDDGLESHLTTAIPLLNEHRLCATFYLCPSGPLNEWLARAERWRPGLGAGHEIGNHTLSHPVPVALADAPHAHCYEYMTLEQYRDDVLEAQRRLEQAFGRRKYTFCYPCYQTWVGTGRQRQSVVPFIAEHFLAGAAGGEISKPYNHPGHLDLHALMSLRADNLAEPDLFQRIEQATDMGRWLILTFHGVDEGHLPIARDALAKLLSFLDQRRNQLWTAPVAEVAEYLRRVRWSK